MKGMISNKKYEAYLGLLLVVFIWGVLPIITAFMLDLYSACIYSAVSGFFSAVCLVLISRKKFKNLNSSYLKVAIPTGIINTLASLLQKIGLNYTTPMQYAFLENLSIISVPIVLFIAIGKKPNVLTVFSCLFCLSGAYVLSGANLFGGALGIGEILCALSGIMYGVNIALTGAYSKGLDSSEIAKERVQLRSKF